MKSKNENYSIIFPLIRKSNNIGGIVCSLIRGDDYI
jgi:hypothetical protein